MASSFNRWEKDPFFSVAEEVQESADRMVSTYRTWIHAKKDVSGAWNFEELRRDLRTALGTTKWQLEEFAKAVQSSYSGSSSEDARDRHREFIIAIEDQVSKIEKSLQESALSEGKTSMPWVHLDEGECNELALFLSGPSVSGDKKLPPKIRVRDNEIPHGINKESGPDCSKNSNQSVEWSSSEAKGEKSHGHRRTASASADIGAWKISITDDVVQQNSSNGQPSIPPRKVPSLSGFLNSMESVTKLKWSKNGIRKWKAVDRHQESDTELLRPQLARGINTCYERSCLDCDDCYDKQLYGWYGAIQRQLRRSQYQMQYGRPIQLAVWVVLFLCLIVLIAFCRM
ncbi:hypothetical protein PTKIN_Ptkin01aG0064000 [Pterospermum kingtungense]